MVLSNEYISLLLLSILLNIFLLFNNSIKGVMEKSSDIVTNSTNAMQENPNNIQDENELFSNNPIDNFFNIQFENPKSSGHMRRVAALYKDSWQLEMNHAYGYIV